MRRGLVSFVGMELTSIFNLLYWSSGLGLRNTEVLKQSRAPLETYCEPQYVAWSFSQIGKQNQEMGLWQWLSDPQADQQRAFAADAT